MTQASKILIVDDEENIRWVFKKALEKRHYTVHLAESGETALEKIRHHDYLLVFSDIFMAGLGGFELLEQINRRKHPPRVVVMTAQDTMNNAIEAMRRGAFDYISKPFDFEEIYALVDKAVKSGKIQAAEEPAPEEAAGIQPGGIIGRSKKMQLVFKTIGKAAGSDYAVLITGESGTGKEMVARALHQYSQRAHRPLVCINCAAIARELLEPELFGHERGAFTGASELKKGKFELANGGAIFLDEIGDMELALQAKILRVLQNNEFYRVGGKEPVRVDVRVIAATNQDLEDLMAKKLFREDLFHRLNVIHIHLPPLRERREDVPVLANYFLNKLSRELSASKVCLSPDVEQIFKDYTWRGNIRELENVIKRGIVLAASGPILPEHLPDYLRAKTAPERGAAETLGQRLHDYLREYIIQNRALEREDLHSHLLRLFEEQLFSILLEKCAGKQIAAAKILGINRNTLKRKLDDLGFSSKRRGAEE